MVGPSKQANIHTHVRNEVTLVWGSSRSEEEEALLRENFLVQNLPMYTGISILRMGLRPISDYGHAFT